MHRLLKLDHAAKDDVLRAVRETFQPVKDRRISAIYFLFDQKELVYVGQAVDVFARVATHALDALKKFDNFAYLEVPREDLNEIEASLIHACWPTRYNRSCHYRASGQFYSDGIRSGIVEAGGMWVARSEYYDPRTGSASYAERSFASADEARSGRLKLNNEIRAEQSAFFRNRRNENQELKTLGLSRKDSRVPIDLSEVVEFLGGIQ